MSILGVIGGGASGLPGRVVGSLNFATMTPTTVTSSPVVIDDVTYTQTTLPYGAAWSGTNAWAVSSAGLDRAGGGTGNRGLMIALSDFCDEALDNRYACAITVVFDGGTPTGSGVTTILLGANNTITDGLGVQLDATIVRETARRASVYATNRDSSHGGNVTTIGANFEPGRRGMRANYNDEIPTGVPWHPSEMPVDVIMETQGYIAEASSSFTHMFIGMSDPAGNADFQLQSVHVWTSKPAG